MTDGRRNDHASPAGQPGPDRRLPRAVRHEVATGQESPFRWELASADADVHRVLALLDGAVSWLSSRGITEQWGTAAFSAVPRRVAQAAEWVRSGATLFAVTPEGDAGCLVLGTAPPYVAPPDRPECYVTLLVAARDPWARGVGRRLLTCAGSVARRLEVERLRVDCFAGGDQALVRYYESAGFRREETFTVGSWPGQVLSMALD